MNKIYFKKTEKGRTYVFIPELDRWVYSNLANKELKKLGIDPQEWYDKHILRLDDESSRPKCKECGKEIKWGGITIGYPTKFCSFSCSTKYRYSHPDEYENFIKIQREIYENGSVWYMKSNPEKYKDSLESYINFNKNGGAWGLMNKNPEKFSSYHEKMDEFYSRGGSYGYMINHSDKYKESLDKMKQNLIDINSNGGGINLMKSNPEKYKDSLESYINFNKNGGAARLMRDKMSTEDEFIYECKLSKGTAFSKYSGLDEAFLYLQVFDDKIKIGTSKKLNAEERRLCSIRYNNNNILPIEEFVFKSSIENVVECEYQSKIRNFSNLYNSNSTEIFKLDAKSSILKCINEFKLIKVDLTNQLTK